MAALGFSIRCSLAAQAAWRYSFSAASTAVITGLVRAMTAFLPPAMRRRTHLALQPDFLALRSGGRLRCMVSLRVGILLITGGMALTAWLKEKREHAPSGKEA